MLPTRRRLRRPGEQRLTVGASHRVRLPTPLALSSAGVITGTPTGVSSTNVTIRVTGQQYRRSDPGFHTGRCPATDHFDGVASCPQACPTSRTLRVSALPAECIPYTWNRVGTLPAGLTLSPGGQISGTPTTAGTSTFTIRAFDSSTPPQNFQKSFTLRIITALSITTASPMPPATTGVAYSQSLTAAGGTPHLRGPSLRDRERHRRGCRCLPRESSAGHPRLQALRISPSVPLTAVLQRRPQRRRCPSWPATRSQSRRHRRCLRGCLAFLTRKL